MRTRLIVVAVFLLLVGVGVVAGTYFYDQGKRDLIAEGVKVNNVPIGGLTRAQAEQKLSASLLNPSTARSRSPTRTTPTRSPRRLPRSASTSRGPWTRRGRAPRRARCSRVLAQRAQRAVNTELAADVTYNKPAIDKLVKRVRKSLERKAEDATLDLSKGQVDPTTSQTGVRVKYNTLAKDVETTLLTPTPRTR